MMRRLVGSGAAAAVALLSIASHAGDPPVDASPPASTPPIAYHALPQGHLLDMPAGDKRPAAVGAGSKASGLFVVHPHEEGPRQLGMTEAYLVGSATMAKAVAQSGFVMPEDGASCVTTSTRVPDSDGDGPWQGSSESRSEIAWRTQMPGVPPAAMKRMMEGNPRVQAAHLERLTRAGDGKSATLDWVDAWVDPVTTGAQTIGKGSITFNRVATGPAGIEVYAARDQGAVHFVVRTADLPEGDERMAMMFTRQIQATMSDPTRRAASDCGFLRVTLPAGPKADDMASFEMRALLPPLRPAPKPAADDAANAVPQTRITAAQQPRRRLLVVNVSSTQTTADAEPVVSVSFGWDGKDEGE